jgi:hypothetical protein
MQSKRMPGSMLNRRYFVKLLGVTVATVGGVSLIGCRSNNNNASTQPGSPAENDSPANTPEPQSLTEEKVFLAPALDSSTDKYGYINETGEWVIEPQFDEAWPFAENGLAHTGYGEFINGKGETVIDMGSTTVNGVEGFAFETSGFANGFAAMEFTDKETYDDLCGFINETGTWAIEPQFAKVGKFASNGLAPAAILDDTYVYLWGFIDRTGRWAISPQYRDIGGVMSMGLNPTHIGFADNGWAAVEDTETRQWGFIDVSGNWVIDPQYGQIYGVSQNGIAVAFAEREQYADAMYAVVLDENGSETCRVLGQFMAPFGSNGLAPLSVSTGGDVTDASAYSTGFVDLTGKWVIAPQFFVSGAGSFTSNGLAVVVDKSLKLYGYIDSSGAWIIEPQFKFAGNFGPAYVPIGYK